MGKHFSILVFAGCALLLASCGVRRDARPAVDPSLPLIGYVDVPAEGAILKGEFRIGGWALWGEGVQAVQIWMDGSLLNSAVQVGIARPDVVKAHPEHGNQNSGWGSPSVHTAFFVQGKHQITVKVVSSSGKTQELKTFAVTFEKP